MTTIQVTSEKFVNKCVAKMVKCVVRGCPNRQDKGKDTGTTPKRFFSFPQDPSRVKVWLAALRETDRDPSDFSEICEDHFLPDHITHQGISEDAIPLPPYLEAPAGACESSEGEQEVAAVKLMVDPKVHDFLVLS